LHLLGLPAQEVLFLQAWLQVTHYLTQEEQEAHQAYVVASQAFLEASQAFLVGV